MSLILDALNRSESDRSGADAAPGLHAVHGPATSPETPTWKKLLWPALALVLAMFALLPWLIERPAPPPSSSQPEPVQSLPGSVERIVEPTVEPIVEPTVEPASAPALSGPAPAARQSSMEAAPAPAGSKAVAGRAADVAVNEDVAALYNRPASDPAARPSQTAAPLTPAKPSRRDDSGVRAAAAGSGSAPASQSDAATPAGSDPDTPSAAAQARLDVDALARAAAALLEEGASDSAPVVEHSAPFISELNQRTKDEIPSIFYSSHRWASDPADRSVVLNGEVRREGDQVKPGLRLLEILEDSIVLEFRDIEFRLRALNSWVNL